MIELLRLLVTISNIILYLKKKYYLLFVKKETNEKLLLIKVNTFNNKVCTKISLLLIVLKTGLNFCV